MNFTQWLKNQVIIGIYRLNMPVNKPAQQFVELLWRITGGKLNKTIIYVINITPVIHVPVSGEGCIGQYCSQREIGVVWRIIQNAGYPDIKSEDFKRFAHGCFPIAKIF